MRIAYIWAQIWQFKAKLKTKVVFNAHFTDGVMMARQVPVLVLSCINNRL